MISEDQESHVPKTFNWITASDALHL